LFQEEKNSRYIISKGRCKGGKTIALSEIGGGEEEGKEEISVHARVSPTRKGGGDVDSFHEKQSPEKWKKKRNTFTKRKRGDRISPLCAGRKKRCSLSTGFSGPRKKKKKEDRPHRSRGGGKGRGEKGVSEGAAKGPPTPPSRGPCKEKGEEENNTNYY